MARKRFTRTRSERAVRKVFVIATEGRRTEEIYFEVFNGEEFRQNVRVKALPAGKGDSSPKGVLARLQRYAREEGIGRTDELWAVVDVDQWGDQALNELCARCQELGYSIAVSNPCFELWLNLHQVSPRTPPAASECQREMERLLGTYDKASYDVKRLLPHILLAIEHARRLDLNPKEPWPRGTGTHVYRLVERLVQK